jgi:lipopolysaccharide/colanic/teichoic acid biosynthesis glycosyltransferase
MQKKYLTRQYLPVKNSLRLKYVNEQSLYTDIKILILTFITLLKKILKK